MTTRDSHHTMSSDHDFDQAARRHYAESVATLSPQTAARLRAARHTALTTAPMRRGLNWVLAGSCAAVFAIAIALQLQREPPAAALPVQTAATPVLDAVDAGRSNPDDAEIDSLLAALDESPDLYLWLAANDDALPPPSEQ